MPYRLRDGISFCHVDGCLVFLDLQADRYFRLSGRMERAFRCWLEGIEACTGDVQELARRNILTQVRDGEAQPLPQAIDVPTRSLLENHAGLARSSVATALKVFALVAWTQLMLRTCRLESIIQRTISLRDRSATAAPGPASGGPCPPRLVEATQQFMRCRLAVPIETCCLLDSLALLRFLSRRGLPVNLVFGVALDPFAAHCWVQAGSWVLNDTLGNVAAHTPIRKI